VIKRDTNQGQRLRSSIVAEEKSKKIIQNVIQQIFCNIETKLHDNKTEFMQVDDNKGNMHVIPYNENIPIKIVDENGNVLHTVQRAKKGVK